MNPGNVVLVSVAEGVEMDAGPGSASAPPPPTTTLADASLLLVASPRKASKVLTRDTYLNTASTYSFPPPSAAAASSPAATSSAKKKVKAADGIKSRIAAFEEKSAKEKQALMPKPRGGGASETSKIPGAELAPKQPYRSPYAYTPVKISPPKRSSDTPSDKNASTALPRSAVTSPTPSTLSTSKSTPAGSGYISPYAYRPTTHPKRSVDVDAEGKPVERRNSTSSSVVSGKEKKLSCKRASNESSTSEKVRVKVRKASLISSTSITPTTKPQWKVVGPPQVHLSSSTTPRVLYKASSRGYTKPATLVSPLSASDAFASKLTSITSTATVTIAARNQMAAGLASSAIKRPLGQQVRAKPSMTQTSIRLAPGMKPSDVKAASRAAKASKNKEGKDQLPPKSPMSPVPGEKKVTKTLSPMATVESRSASPSPSIRSTKSSSGKKAATTVTTVKTPSKIITSTNTSTPATSASITKKVVVAKEVVKHSTIAAPTSDTLNETVRPHVDPIKLFDPPAPSKTDLTTATSTWSLSKLVSATVAAAATVAALKEDTSAAVALKSKESTSTPAAAPAAEPVMMQTPASPPVPTKESEEDVVSSVVLGAQQASEAAPAAALSAEEKKVARRLTMLAGWLFGKKGAGTPTGSEAASSPRVAETASLVSLEDGVSVSGTAEIEPVSEAESVEEVPVATVAVMERIEVVEEIKVVTEVKEVTKEVVVESKVMAFEDKVVVSVDKATNGVDEKAMEVASIGTDEATVTTRIPDLATTQIDDAVKVIVSEDVIDKMEIIAEESEDVVLEEEAEVPVVEPAPIKEEVAASAILAVETLSTPFVVDLDVVMEEDEATRTDDRVAISRPENHMMDQDDMTSDSSRVESVSLRDLVVNEIENHVPVLAQRISLDDLQKEQQAMERESPEKRLDLEHLLVEAHIPVERISADQLMYDQQSDSGDSSSRSGSYPDLDLMRRPSPPATPETIYDAKPFGISDFRLIKTVGTGSFGRVHLALHTRTNTHVALKVLRKADVVKLKQVEHTLDEKRILEALCNGCPFLVHLYGSFVDSEHLYLVLEYIQGGELFTYLRNVDKLDNESAKFYAAEVVLAFEYLHSANVVYRDLKPENLLIDSRGHIRVTDFGFAKHLEGDETHTLCGTPDYLAPEVIQSKGYGKSVDWWALGILIYEMIAGHPPFFDDDPFRLYEKIVACRLAFPPFMHPLAKDLIRRLLTPDLTRRYGNLRDGALDIKMHPWFQGVDWDAMWELRVDAPYIPEVEGDGDTSHFDEYEEDYAPYGRNVPDPYADKFKDF